MSYSDVKEPVFFDFTLNQALLPIGFGDVHLWICDDEIESTHAMHQRFWSLLSKEEMAQHSRFYFEKDRSRYLLTRALVRTVLSRYANVSPSEWQFKKTSNGRPYVVEEEEREIVHLSFNISHTQGLIIVGVTNSVTIGVDVEDTSRVLIQEIANQVFSAEEVAKMQILSKEEQRRYFFALWTLKESYVKARGMGSRLPLNQIAFDIGNDFRIAPCLNRMMNDTKDRWQFWQLYPDDHHVVAICAEVPMTDPLKLTCRKIFPLCWENVLDGMPAWESR